MTLSNRKAFVQEGTFSSERASKISGGMSGHIFADLGSGIAAAMVIAFPALAGRSMATKGHLFNASAAYAKTSNCMIVKINSSGVAFRDGRLFDQAMPSLIAGKSDEFMYEKVVIEISPVTPFFAISSLLEQMRLRGINNVCISVLR
jgi:hypothetical protein